MLWVHVGVDGSIDCQVNVGNKVRQGNGFELFIVTETNNVENFEINRVGYIKPGEQEIVSLNAPVRREENIEFELNRPSQANSFFKGGVTYNGYMASIPSDATTFYGNGGHIQLVIYAVSVDGRSENTQNVTVFVEPTYGSKYVGISVNDYSVILGLIDSLDGKYVKKLGVGRDYRVYMVNPRGIDTYRIASSSVVGEAVVLRTSTGQLELPDQKNVIPPSGSQAISKAFADDKYILDQKTTDFHPITTLRWLNADGNREMAINGTNIIFYTNDGKQQLVMGKHQFTYLGKPVTWESLYDIVENSAPLLNGDRGAIGSYTSAGNGISSATTFAGSNITNTAKGINSFSLGRLNAVEGVGCLAYGNKNIVKGACSVALGGGNISGDRIDWTSASASVNNSSVYCISIGENNTTTGRSAVSAGISNNSQGDGSISVGRGNTVWSKESVAIGRSNTLNKVSTGSYDEQEPDQGNGVVAIGTGLMTPKRWNDVNLESLYWNCVVVGRYNDPYVYGCARSTDLPYKNNCAPVFTLGNGSDDSNRRNSIVTFHNPGFQERKYDWTYINDYCIFNQICEFRNANNIFENNITVWGIVKDKQGVQYLKGGQISDTFINSLF